MTFSINASSLNKLYQDRSYQLALLAGPLVWFVLGSLDQKESHFDVLFWSILSFCVIYPVVEELVFRGVLQRHLYSYSIGKAGYLGFSGANVITTIMFAGMHLVHQPFVWALLVIVPSLLFGWFRDKYNSVIPGLILHVFYNTGFYIIR
ncbi:MAG: JDVT-CTERM system CAAX-type protease [Gammaproteobacteria bacterium]|nr:JDVT-CTERM system CAAX-type protease [Gammaproteobacteria bacterium]